MKNIILIGSGNVATHLGLSLYKHGYKIKQVWSQKLINAEILAKKLNSKPTNNIEQIEEADLYIMSIKDDAVESMLEKLYLNNIIHTSGSIGIEVFNNKLLNYGVLYPLQTFNKDVKLNLSKTPICIEASNKHFEKELLKIGNKMSEKAIIINSEQRKQLHIAAVFCCNFTNYLFSISEKILTKANSDFKLLIPLINQTVEKISNFKPSEVQTGPANRKDKKIIQHHIDIIKDKQAREIYKLLSNAIMKNSE